MRALCLVLVLITSSALAANLPDNMVTPDTTIGNLVLGGTGLILGRMLMWHRDGSICIPNVVNIEQQIHSQYSHHVEVKRTKDGLIVSANSFFQMMSEIGSTITIIEVPPYVECVRVVEFVNKIPTDRQINDGISR